MQVYRSDFAVEHKAGGEGPVTLADHRADAVIRHGLAAAFPGDAVLSEETPDDLRRLSHHRLWLVDPLDGTRQFVERVGEFAVMIGLVTRGRPVLGVIHLPVEGETWAGVAGIGAFQVALGVGRPALRIPAGPPGGRRPILAMSREHGRSRTQPVLEKLNPAGTVFSGSVGRKAVLLLKGQADLYLTLGSRSRHWDSCAPQALVEAAGGFFGNAWGRPLVYNTDRTTNKHGLLACCRGLLPEVVQAVVEVWGDVPEGP